MEFVQRPAEARKGEWGKLLVLAGSAQLAGAAVLTTKGALRTGLDSVVFAGPQRAADAVLHTLPGSVTLPLVGHVFESRHLKLLDYFQAYPVVVGPGLTLRSAAESFTKALLKKFSGPFVIDADAVRHVNHERNPAKLWEGKTVIVTPNRAEFDKITEKITGTIDRAEKVRQIAQDWRAIVLAKGPIDYLSDGERTEEIKGGSPYLAKGGSGDVLTGVIGALLSRLDDPFEAAKLGTRLVKEAGERLANERGPGMLAEELADYLDLRRLKR